MKEKKITYSKLVLLITGAIFVFCLIKGLYADLDTVIDTTVFVTSISVSGAIFGTTCVNYFRKSCTENSYKMKTMFYKYSVKERLFYNEEMMKLKQKYNMTDDDLCDIDNQGEADEVMNEAFADESAFVNNKVQENETVQDVQSFSL